MINLNDSSMIVQYIQNFLKENYNPTLVLSDVYDIDTHKALINYLKRPEIIDAFTLKDKLLDKFTFTSEEKPNTLINEGGLWNFNFDINPDQLHFYTRRNQDCYSGGTSFILNHLDEVKDFCKKYGWMLIDYQLQAYDKVNKTKLPVTFTIHKCDYTQIFPVNDVLPMINLNCGEALINKAIASSNSYTGVIQDVEGYKTIYIEASAGDTFTICSGYKTPTSMAIGCSNHSIYELQREEHVIDNVIVYSNNSLQGTINSREYIKYEIPENLDCKYLLIQVPISTMNENILVMLGDYVTNNKGNILNIPFDDFCDNPWLVHDCFDSYVLGACIHRHSHMNDIIQLQDKISAIMGDYIGIRPGFYDTPEDYLCDEWLKYDELDGVYKYYKGDGFYGYVLNSTDVQNGKLVYDGSLTYTGYELIDGHVLYNGMSTGRMILKSGQLTKEGAEKSLKEIIKNIQIGWNENEDYHNNNNKIQFISGNVDPKTESVINYYFDFIK